MGVTESRAGEEMFESKRNETLRMMRGLHTEWLDNLNYATDFIKMSNKAGLVGLGV
jgi:hypothetical protein